MLPRGVLVVAVSAMPVTRDYIRPSGQRSDSMSWRLVTARRPMRTTDPSVMIDRRSLDQVASRASTGPDEFGDVAVAPVPGAVVPGYPASIIAARAAGRSAFTQGDLERLGESAAQFVCQKQSRAAPPSRDAPTGVTIVAADGRPIFPNDQEALAGIDATLVNAMSDAALAVAAGEETSITRWCGRTAAGLCVPFRVVRHPPDPTDEQDGKPTVWFARTPSPSEFAAIDQSDLELEPELARLLPAVAYMRAEFARLPSLAEIARQVHLSPFHFHRRFSDLVGITPKHFLLDCQIELAQDELRADEKSLSEIAKACGFSHQSHFTSRFKQATGLTPMQWRKRVGEA
jgi:AraC-like DNA-binding protein